MIYIFYIHSLNTSKFVLSISFSMSYRWHYTIKGSNISSQTANGMASLLFHFGHEVQVENGANGYVSFSPHGHPITNICYTTLHNPVCDTHMSHIHVVGLQSNHIECAVTPVCQLWGEETKIDLFREHSESRRMREMTGKKGSVRNTVASLLFCLTQVICIYYV